MSLRKNILAKSLVAILLLAMTVLVNAQEDKELKDFEAKHPNGIAVGAKILSIDPVKGDVSLRLEFIPQGNLVKEEDGTLAKTIKFDTESSNGKQEVTFEKGKRMHATEVVLNMYGDPVEDYPFDDYNADLYLQFITKPDKKKEEKKDANAEEPDKPKETEAEEDAEDVVPHFLMFQPTLPSYAVTTAKNKDSDEGYTSLTLAISRSSVVKLFSSFMLFLMWGITLAVAGLTFMVVIGGRKAEIAMFSFITALLFAFVAVRNNLPGAPPVGTWSDKLSFFWAVGILGLCLIAIVFTWVFRKPS